ncbi:TnpV protein [Faecalibacillus faecis]|uniref:TnpV protein n=1 Tax=Faecalibacillus faecis TaxID=1982628 RepID=UPI003AB4DEB8
MKEMEYIQVGDYQLPNLKVEEMHLNRFGRAKLDYLKKHDYLLYFKLLSKNELNDYLLKVQKEADDLYERLVEEYKIKWNVTEELKQKNQIKWVQMMNNIKSCVDEIVYKTLLN